jgi:hypothetical protein
MFALSVVRGAAPLAPSLPMRPCFPSLPRDGGRRSLPLQCGGLRRALSPDVCVSCLYTTLRQSQLQSIRTYGSSFQLIRMTVVCTFRALIFPISVFWSWRVGVHAMLCNFLLVYDFRTFTATCDAEMGVCFPLCPNHSAVLVCFTYVSTLCYCFSFVLCLYRSSTVTEDTNVRGCRGKWWRSATPFTGNLPIETDFG